MPLDESCVARTECVLDIVDGLRQRRVFLERRWLAIQIVIVAVVLARFKRWRRFPAGIRRLIIGCLSRILARLASHIVAAIAVICVVVVAVIVAYRWWDCYIAIVVVSIV